MSASEPILDKFQAGERLVGDGEWRAVLLPAKGSAEKGSGMTLAFPKANRHTKHLHTCEKCGRAIRGNAIGLHRKACDGTNWATEGTTTKQVYSRKRSGKLRGLTFADRLQCLQRHAVTFWRFVSRQECWEWTGPTMPNGYGRFGVYDAQLGIDLAWVAHRAAWELMMGEIPVGLQLDHRCRNICCVNPCSTGMVLHEEKQADAVQPEDAHDDFGGFHVRITEYDTVRASLCGLSESGEV